MLELLKGALPEILSSSGAGIFGWISSAWSHAGRERKKLKKEIEALEVKHQAEITALRSEIADLKYRTANLEKEASDTEEKVTDMRDSVSDYAAVSKFDAFVAEDTKRWLEITEKMGKINGFLDSLDRNLDRRNRG